LRQITDTVPALIAYIDAEQRFQFHNLAYEEGFGLKYEQIHGKTMRETMATGGLIENSWCVSNTPSTATPRVGESAHSAGVSELGVGGSAPRLLKKKPQRNLRFLVGLLLRKH
jgi:hypothetical protein